MTYKIKILDFPERKKIRARIIANHIRRTSYRGVVAFSCGNATRELKLQGLQVIDISPAGDLRSTEKWWTVQEIHEVFPDYFDATSGHLTAALMVEIAKAFREHIGALPEKAYKVPTGSGETIICLRWAYPEIIFIPIYNISAGTVFDIHAPLNYAVDDTIGG